MADEKRGPGQPTKYKPEYDDLIIEIMKTGASAIEFCAEVGIDKDTLQEWRKVQPTFSVSYTRAKILCQAWWEREGRTNLHDVSEYDGETKTSTSSKFNDRLYTKTMAIRFEDWREIKTLNITTPLEGDKSLLEALIAKPEVTK